jgi:hypothetical protein
VEWWKTERPERPPTAALPPPGPMPGAMPSVEAAEAEEVEEQNGATITAEAPSTQTQGIPLSQMVRIPLLHETMTVASAGAMVVTGNRQAAAKAIEDWKSESVVGSGVLAVLGADTREAGAYARGFRRAAGKAVLGGGILRNVPVFHELATTGEALADVVGDGDTQAASKRFTAYKEEALLATSAQMVLENVGKGFDTVGKGLKEAKHSLGANVRTMAGQLEQAEGRPSGDESARIASQQPVDSAAAPAPADHSDETPAGAAALHGRARRRWTDHDQRIRK